uniref:Uncharacterized protein n=1 Tax=Oryza glumipatula TaxID=40148 RepID=A0A0D9ZI07_9ORYZ
MARAKGGKDRSVPVWCVRVYFGGHCRVGPKTPVTGPRVSCASDRRSTELAWNLPSKGKKFSGIGRNRILFFPLSFH